MFVLATSTVQSHKQFNKPSRSKIIQLRSKELNLSFVSDIGIHMEILKGVDKCISNTKD